MKNTFRAIGLALLSMLHPRMLWLAVWPFLIAAVGWSVVGWLAMDAGLRALKDGLFDFTIFHWIDDSLRLFGVRGWLEVLVPLLYIFLLVALTVVTALLIVGLVAMPAVVDHVAKRTYPRLERLGGANTAAGVANTLWATLICLLGWLVTMPLWLFIPLAFFLPLFWWAWLAARVLRFDALAAHASSEERAELIARFPITFMVLGVVTAGLNFVPPLILLSPIFGGLMFTHFALHALAQLRAERAAAMPASAIETSINEESSGHAAPPHVLTADEDTRS